MCASVKLMIFNYLLLQLRLQLHVGPFSMAPFPRIVSAELNEFEKLKLFLEHVYFHIACNLDIAFRQSSSQFML